MLRESALLAERVYMLSLAVHASYFPSWDIENLYVWPALV